MAFDPAGCDSLLAETALIPRNRSQTAAAGLSMQDVFGRCCQDPANAAEKEKRMERDSNPR